MILDSFCSTNFESSEDVSTTTRMGLRSASSSSDNYVSSLSSEEEEDVACVAPLGNNGSMGRGRECYVRMGFLLVAKVGRGRGRCVRMGFFVGCKCGERKRVLGEKGAFVGC
jgi:hypothetical protein